MAKELFVIDTNTIVNFFSKVFEECNSNIGFKSIGPYTASRINDALQLRECNTLISVPSIVFIEIYKNWLRCEKEFAHRFRYEVFEPINNSPNMEIRAIDQEVLENLLSIEGCLKDHEMNDKIVVASAITLQCSIMTADSKIREYVKHDSRIPRTIC
jgi:PIN domain nuclease of toxin-antitoxin system